MPLRGYVAVPAPKSIARSAAAARLRAATMAPTVTELQTVRPLPSFADLQAVLFDIDGTLTNTDPLHLKVFQDKLVEDGFNSGVPIDEDFFRVHIAGRHNPSIMADLYPEMPRQQQEEWSLDKEARFRQLAGIHPIAGLREFLAWLDSRGLPSVAVTNAPRANAEMMLKGLGLDTYFKALIIGEECSRAKPFPDPYLKGLKVLGIEPQHAIVVEDSPSGIAAAVAAGVAVVGVTTGQEAGALLAAGAATTIQDYHDLLKLAVPPAADT